MKWKSFWPSLLLPVMTAKRIKEPGIFRAKVEQRLLAKEDVVRASLYGRRTGLDTFLLGKYYRKIIRVALALLSSGKCSLIIRRDLHTPRYQDRQDSSPSLDAWLIY